MSTQDFLFELGTEELPPKALQSMQDALHQSIVDGIKQQSLNFESSQAFASPRRLAVLIKGLDEEAPSKNVTVEGPPKKVAVDADGNYTRAAEAFAKKNGVSIESLGFEDTKKGEKLVHRFEQQGAKASDVLADIVKAAINSIPVPKRMRWGASREEFSRPVQWLLCLLGETVVPFTQFGLKSSNQTFGHRFHYNQALTITNPSDYESLLAEQGYVVADYNSRKSQIEAQVLEAANTLGGEAIFADGLLDEVCGLVEKPFALTGKFEERFLAVPKEALISSMVEHQKYFAVVDKAGNLMPNFIFISNLQSKDPTQVIEGNEKVIRPRLADAAFFFETDLKRSLESRLEGLDRVVFQTKLGSIGDKSRRIATLAGSIASALKADTAQAERAGRLAKADLVSEMVLEFDKLQGIAGSYYASNDGEAAPVANAIAEHYLPKGMGDTLPSDDVALSVALADRIDTLIGIFGIGQFPTGSKDPFALRRAALAIIRIVQEKQLATIDLAAIFAQAAELHGDNLSNDTVLADAAKFLQERYRAIYQDQSVDVDCLFAVQAVVDANANPFDINERVLAVSQFKALPEAEALASANKRVGNILAKNADQAIAENVDTSLFSEAAETALNDAIDAVKAPVLAAIEAKNYSDALQQLASLRSSVDDFFDNVMVMADDPSVRNNRMALLSGLRTLFQLTADIGELQF